MKKLILWLTQTKLWSWLLLNVIPYIRFSTYYTPLRGKTYHEGYRILSPGQFVLTLDDKKMTALLVPGLMTHAGFVKGKANPELVSGGFDDFEIAEMTHANFTRSHFFDICKESSRVLICDCVDWDMDHRRRMVDALPSFYNALYDVQFTLGIAMLYCSELILQLDRKASANGSGRMIVDLSDLCGLGRPYISPDGLLFARNTRVLWDSKGEFTGMMGPEVLSLCIRKGYIRED